MKNVWHGVTMSDTSCQHIRNKIHWDSLALDLLGESMTVSFCKSLFTSLFRLSYNQFDRSTLRSMSTFCSSPSAPRHATPEAKGWRGVHPIACHQWVWPCHDQCSQNSMAVAMFPATIAKRELCTWFIDIYSASMVSTILLGSKPSINWWFQKQKISGPNIQKGACQRPPTLLHGQGVFHREGEESHFLSGKINANGAPPISVILDHFCSFLYLCLKAWRF